MTSQSATTSEQRAWFFYDWANSAYATTIGSVLFAPYLTSVAERSSCGYAGTDSHPCNVDIHVVGLGLSPGSLVFYAVTLSTVLSAFALPIVGAAADRSAHKKDIMARLAWAGSVFAAAMFFVTGTDWQLGTILLLGGNMCLGASLVVYDSILCDIAAPDDRDRVSSRGWATGYLGGGILLALNLVVVVFHNTFGLGEGFAVRLSLLSAAIWWGGFTIIPWRGIADRQPTAVEAASGGLVRQSFGQLWATLREMRGYPVTMTFLAAYLFFNDGIQTVIATASTYGEKQLGFSTQLLIATILLVQFIAFGGALLFGRIAASYGSKKTITGGLVVWMAVVVIAYVMPRHQAVAFFAMAVLIGIVLGGTQALSRSFYSQLIPKGREAEYFSLYQACERGTSWLGTLTFGVVHQLTDSYRPAVLALFAFFAIGLGLLVTVNARRGIAEAGNPEPVLV